MSEVINADTIGHYVEPKNQSSVVKYIFNYEGGQFTMLTGSRAWSDNEIVGKTLLTRATVPVVSTYRDALGRIVFEPKVVGSGSSNNISAKPFSLDVYFNRNNGDPTGTFKVDSTAGVAYATVDGNNRQFIVDDVVLPSGSKVLTKAGYGPYQAYAASNGYVALSNPAYKTTAASDGNTSTPTELELRVRQLAAAAGVMSFDDVVSMIGVNQATWYNPNAYRADLDNSNKFVGYRRIVIFSPGTNVIMWLPGAGDDKLIYRTNLHLDNQWNIGWKVATLLDDSEAKLLSLNGNGTTVSALYPIGCADGLFELITCASAVEQSEVQNVTIDASQGTYFTYEERTYQVQISGNLDIDFYREYCTTAFGLSAAPDKEISDAAVKTWIDYSNLGFGYVTGRCTTPILKVEDTENYAKYAKARKKACKDNDYMSLEYMTGMTFADLNKILSTQYTRDIWVGQRGSGVTVGTQKMSAVVISVNASDKQKFDAKRPDGAVTYALNESGAQAMLMTIASNEYVSDPNSILAGYVPVDASGEYLKKDASTYFPYDGNTTATRYSTLDDIAKLNDANVLFSYVAFNLTTAVNIQPLVKALHKKLSVDNLYVARVDD